MAKFYESLEAAKQAMPGLNPMGTAAAAAYEWSQLPDDARMAVNNTIRRAAAVPGWRILRPEEREQAFASTTGGARDLQRLNTPGASLPGGAADGGLGLRDSLAADAMARLQGKEVEDIFKGAATREEINAGLRQASRRNQARARQVEAVKSGSPRQMYETAIMFPEESAGLLTGRAGAMESAAAAEIQSMIEAQQARDVATIKAAGDVESAGVKANADLQAAEIEARGRIRAAQEYNLGTATVEQIRNNGLAFRNIMDQAGKIFAANPSLATASSENKETGKTEYAATKVFEGLIAGALSAGQITLGPGEAQQLAQQLGSDVASGRAAVGADAVSSIAGAAPAPAPAPAPPIAPPNPAPLPAGPAPAYPDNGNQAVVNFLETILGIIGYPAEAYFSRSPVEWGELAQGTGRPGSPPNDIPGPLRKVVDYFIPPIQWGPRAIRPIQEQNQIFLRHLNRQFGDDHSMLDLNRMVNDSLLGGR